MTVRKRLVEIVGKDWVFDGVEMLIEKVDYLKKDW